MPGTGKGAGLALQIGEDAIAPFAMKAFELPAKISFVVHDVLPLIVAAGSVLFESRRQTIPCVLLAETLTKLVFKPLPGAGRLRRSRRRRFGAHVRKHDEIGRRIGDLGVAFLFHGGVLRRRT